jgi:1,2-diacylglycerol 3-alpha-glucosyltransferase
MVVSEITQLPPTGFKIAVAASGLSHVTRGIEGWALETAGALGRAGEDVTLFQGSGTDVSATREATRETLGCVLRSDPRAIQWARRLRRMGLWRVGLSSPFDFEQFTFTWPLWKRIRRDFDILHVQDPMEALWMTKLRRLGLSRPRVILGHGTEETPAWLRQYEVLQHLAPVYLADWEPHRPPGQMVYAVPNFIDVNRFRPCDESHKQAARAEWSIPQDAFVVLCVAALKKTHKRVDYLIREFQTFQASSTRPALLLLAGAREPETEEILELGSRLLGDRARILINVPREKMMSLYHAADVFALASLHEMMPMVLIEAMACGLPVCCNDTPTLRWMAGPCAEPNHIDREGALAEQLQRLTSSEDAQRRSLLARQRAEALFSEAAVVPQIQEMYREVMARLT